MTIYNFIFKLIGGRFYFDWLLISNPRAKNPVIKLLWFWHPGYGVLLKRGRFRIICCFVYGSIHLVGLAMWVLYPKSWMGSVSNLLVNVYPILVQIWIYLRINNVNKIRKVYEQDTKTNRYYLPSLLGYSGQGDSKNTETSN